MKRKFSSIAFCVALAALPTPNLCAITAETSSAVTVGADPDTSVAAPEHKTGAHIEFAELEHNFGTIYESDGWVTCNFEFTNTGDEPLVIVSANAQCGCTRPAFPKAPIKPGAKGKITVSFNPKGRRGEFSKRITVRSNCKQPRTSVKITGKIIPRRTQ